MHFARATCFLISAASLAGFGIGCASRSRPDHHFCHQPLVLVVAPVINLSGSQDFDPLKVTDLIASEAVSCRGVTVVPVNLALAELARRGKSVVETPDDAVQLARALGADATLQTAVTEYNPYFPPVIGMVMQWYDAGAPDDPTPQDTGRASQDRARRDRLSATAETGPRWQVQRVFNAADEDVCEEVQEFASHRDGERSPYAWRKYVRSQELYVRYSSHALIRAILKQDKHERVSPPPDEASS